LPTPHICHYNHATASKRASNGTVESSCHDGASCGCDSS
jgi:hypothetical protein